MTAKVVKIDLDSGVTVYVTPLSPFVLAGISEKAQKAHPTPPVPEKPVPNSVIEGDTYADESDLQWRAAALEAAQLRTNYIVRHTILLSVSVDDSDGVMTQFADRLAQIGEYVDLPGDKWHATLLYCAISSKSEVDVIYEVAQNNAPLTEDEIADGVRYFRVDDQWQVNRRRNAARRLPSRSPVNE